mmetsp:Transcript_29806/g.49189  ORF Transcript_29806/g.49189 Transcript_29806/m.49189 type:complete len:964 (-) Transcript_29806:41-2932(-)|eukprot:CAMPEP_0119008968 /NCGR_PEP_ID=MMETSP1176-20130426/4055_1 /TAXON_ID=265551 /ORGANISM="Synedropsis recta cf, Strain CCMP1620" /LENGTH=963 /DNA_ID=CAMNT_0006961391 /DNA_START=50 /DNA_END=2941 /DNA_ORIENTATION=+
MTNSGEEEEATKGADSGLGQVQRPTRHVSRRDSQARFLHDTDIDALTDEYAKEDKSSTKTLTRIVVEKYLENRNWYFPGRERVNGPRLSKAYAFYEHFTLARHFSEAAAEHKMERAEPGEQAATELYSPFTTPERALPEFGIGVALYFTTLRVLSVILIIAGLIHIPNLLYYSGDEYSNGQQGLVSFSLKGSAVCTIGKWVVCSDCNPDDWDNTEEENRFGIFTDPATGEVTNIVLRNGCGRPGLTQGIVNYVALLFLIISFLLFGVYQRKRETLYDEDKQTATDYSILVKNPPPDAYDPEKWRAFFSQFADKQVVALTIALNNHELLQKLQTRRVLRNSLKAMLPKNMDLEDEDLVRERVSLIMKEQEGEKRGVCSVLCGCTLVPILNLLNYFLPADVLVDKIFDLTEDIKELLKQKYEVTQVYVTFETEAGQRNALEALSTSTMVINLNQTDQVPPSTVYEGKVLHVIEPPEPNTVRWLDLHVSTRRKYTQRFITLVITAGIVGGAGWLVYLCRLNLGSGYSAPLTTVFNSVIPQVVKLLLLVENHANEGSRQESLYLKVTLFRWVNTAILTKVITPFTSTISGDIRDVIPTINAILWSELWLAPFLRLFDPVGNLGKHFVAPRARTQESMNNWFHGTVYNLGERYTDMTKVLFLCFFYSALYPAGFFFCGAILLVQYYTDKYCLMRIWASAPFLGPKLAVFSRRYFFTGALFAYVMVASYDWAQFPYDNLCDPETTDGTNYSRSYTNVFFLGDKNEENPRTLEVEQNSNVVACDQSWRNVDGFPFPATARKMQGDGPDWMTSEQETVTNLYGWSSVVILVLFVVTLFGRSFYHLIIGFFKGIYEPDGVDAQIDFQNVAEISLYVPQFRLGALQFPVLACDVDDLNTNWVGWNDVANPSYDNHNLIFDVPHENMRRQKNQKITSAVADDNAVEASHLEAFPIFSIVKSWSRDQEAHEEAIE